MFLCLYVLIMYVNFVCILLSLFYLYCVHIAFLYSNVRLSHNKRLLTNLLTYLLTYLLTCIRLHVYGVNTALRAHSAGQ